MAKELTMEEVLLGFGQGINCSMFAFSALADEIGISEAEARKIAAGFGGGMGLGSTCGAVTGALMALGYKYGNSGPGQADQMNVFNAKKKAFLDAFTERFGDTNCVALLGGLNVSVPEERAEIIGKNLMQTVCAPAVIGAVEILSEIFAED